MPKRVGPIRATHVPTDLPYYRTRQVAAHLGSSVRRVHQLATELWGPSRKWRLFTSEMIERLAVRYKKTRRNRAADIFLGRG